MFWMEVDAVPVLREAEGQTDTRPGCDAIGLIRNLSCWFWLGAGRDRFSTFALLSNAPSMLAQRRKRQGLAALGVRAQPLQRRWI